MLFKSWSFGGALAACALSLTALSAPVAAEVTRATDNSFVSRHEVIVSASAKAAWLALISPAGWWRSEHTWSGDSANLILTPQAGGCFCETIPEVDEPGRFTLQGSVEHMRVIQSYPEQALRMQGSLGPLQSEPAIGILTITISTVKEGTRIVWEYNVGGSMRYEVPVISKVVDGVMGSQLAALADRLGPVAVAGPVRPAIERAQAITVAEPEAAPDASAKPSAVTLPGPVAKPAPKAAPKSVSVDDAFGDLAEEPNR